METQGYDVVWDGTRASRSGTPYLAAEQFTPEPSAAKPIARGLTDGVLDWLESFGPATIRELADALGFTTSQVNSSILCLKKRGAVAVVDQRPVMVRKFGVRLVAVYGVPE